MSRLVQCTFECSFFCVAISCRNIAICFFMFVRSFAWQPVELCCLLFSLPSHTGFFSFLSFMDRKTIGYNISRPTNAVSRARELFSQYQRTRTHNHHLHCCFEHLGGGACSLAIYRVLSTVFEKGPAVMAAATVTQAVYIGPRSFSMSLQQQPHWRATVVISKAVASPTASCSQR